MPAVKKNMKAMKDKRRRKRVYHERADGSVVSRWASASSDKELPAAIEKVKVELAQEELAEVQSRIANFDSTFKEYATIWYERDCMPRLSQATRSSYLTTFNKHLFPVFGDMKIREITLADVKDWVNSYANKVVDNTLDKTLNRFKEIMSNAAENDVVDSKLIFKLANIKKPIMKEPTEKRRALTSAENDAAHWVGHHNTEGLFLLVLYHLGLRRGEALGLKWGDFDLDVGVVHIRRDLDFYVRKHDGHLDKDKAKNASLKTEKLQRIGRVKSYAGRRTIPIFDVEFLQTLIDRKGADDQYVFVGPLSGEPLSDASFRRMWMRLMKAMVEHAPGIEGIWGTKIIKAEEDGKPVKKEVKVKIRSVLTPHYFRHNFATALYWADVKELQACAWMGHADAAMINKIYGHLRKSDSANEVQKMAEYIKQRASCSRDVPDRLPPAVNQ